MKVLMVGATGKFAGLVVPELKKRGATVRALIRHADQAADAHQHGADETVVGDLNNLESLKKATEGVEGVFHINPAFAPNEAELGVSIVQAAVAAGVRKFVFSGVIHPSLPMTNHQAKLPVEKALYESGLVFTVLQPAMFMQNLAGSWQQVVQSGKLAFPYSKRAKACYVDYRDVAEAAAIALTSSKLDYGTFELCAPGMLDRIELAEIMSEVLGRTVTAEEPTFDDWAAMAHIPEGPLREGLKSMYTNYDRHGFPGGNGLVLRTILGREPRLIGSYIAELAGNKETGTKQQPSKAA
jgi:uncharacterized protein YbjT (DUF2867 family)